MTEENKKYFPLRKDVKRNLKWGTIFLTLFMTFNVALICTDPEINTISGIFFTVLSLPAFLVFFFFILGWIPPLHEATITFTKITERKYWRKRTILWKDVIRIVENPVDPYILGAKSAMGNYFFGIQSKKNTIKFTDYIDQYEKFKELVLNRAGEEDFIYKTHKSHKGIAHEWIKEEK